MEQGSYAKNENILSAQILMEFFKRLENEIESFIETLEVMSDPEAIEDIKEARREYEKGKTTSFDDLIEETGLKDEIWNISF